MDRQFCVYILANKRNGTLYIGVTGDLVTRICQHKNGEIAGFTKKYGIKTLVHYEMYDSARETIEREKQLKPWKRKWKLELIEKENPTWKDLYFGLIKNPGL
ncbi:MAG: GIY-YIG nuclease family protein [Candidatus Gracilibacteria bacterium]|nr:GIY-YIG nuclease family protein [Candidatus Gracilibacteria bacterium]